MSLHIIGISGITGQDRLGDHLHMSLEQDMGVPEPQDRIHKLDYADRVIHVVGGTGGRCVRHTPPKTRVPCLNPLDTKSSIHKQVATTN